MSSALISFFLFYFLFLLLFIVSRLALWAQFVVCWVSLAKAQFAETLKLKLQQLKLELRLRLRAALYVVSICLLKCCKLNLLCAV